MSEFDPQYGTPVPLRPGLQRLTAPNPSPFTGAGTNSYIIGTDCLMVVDPGPDSAEHVAAIVRAVAGRPVSHILITHAHRDHVDALPALRARIDAPTVAEGPHRASRGLHPGEANPFLGSADMAFVPDIIVADGDVLDNGESTVTALGTPGHTANHLAFGYEDVCLTGDHVMGWSTTVIAPPDGSMKAYMRSLDRLLEIPHTRFYPGHGDSILEPRKSVTAMRSHRLMRERAILERLHGPDRTVAALVASLYTGINPKLKVAAGLSVLAHLEKLAEEGRVRADGFGVTATWEPG
ncbi:MBL fold metallo-hydrolase [Acuticoccus sp. MNP-M23]|uniref:MBL fold metallo-hydrolase n=1 Tax=Acuticoccus sp. MNP-M23 TaxID=3072793 RepID=UPI0028169DEE|nr:MBL fold metallo-hydrolase [Acuticoccus sp. MNP-M23]WMS42689.1 MBL fold metallo-hydrolase [Acuticoccus sp. MNP-M23]